MPGAGAGGEGLLWGVSQGAQQGVWWSLNSLQVWFKVNLSQSCSGV